MKRDCFAPEMRWQPSFLSIVYHGITKILICLVPLLVQLHLDFSGWVTFVLGGPPAMCKVAVPKPIGINHEPLFTKLKIHVQYLAPIFCLILMADFQDHLDLDVQARCVNLLFFCTLPRIVLMQSI